MRPGTCVYCGDTGKRSYPDVENGPEFDTEGYCECAVGEARLMADQARSEEQDALPLQEWMALMDDAQREDEEAMSVEVRAHRAKRLGGGW